MMKRSAEKWVEFLSAFACSILFSLSAATASIAGDYSGSGQPYFSLSALVVSADAPNIQSAVSNPALGIGFPGGSASILTAPGASLDSEIGWGLTGAVGWLYDSNWHYEVELGHKAFDLGDGFVAGNIQPVVGEWNVETFFLNGGYDFRGDSFITPYVGLGIGAALHELTFDVVSGVPVAINEQFTVTPAFQAKVGVNLEVADDMDIVLGYRFFTTVNPDFTMISFDRVDIHHFEMGLKFYIEDWINN